MRAQVLAIRMGAWLLPGVVLVPVVLLAANWLGEPTAIWNHLATTQLPSLLGNTLLLIVGVGSLTGLLGTGLAWLTTMYEFPGRRFFDWALALPLAIPPYVIAFTMVGLLDYSGPIAGLLRQNLSLELPAIRNAGGAILLLSLVLYPYVYLLVRAAFIAQGHRALEIARTLGANPLQRALSISIPLARPALSAGIALALMEALADFGAVSVLGFDTFTTAIYKAWFDLRSLSAAAQLASLLLLFTLLALGLERFSRRPREAYQTPPEVRQQRRVPLSGRRRQLACGICSLVFGLGFALPCIELLVWAAQDSSVVDGQFWGLLGRTLTLGVTAAALILVLGTALALARRADGAVALPAQLATLGYALPGSILAVTFTLALVWVDQNPVAAVQRALEQPVRPWLVGGGTALLLAYCARFLALGQQPVDARLSAIDHQLIDSARGLGARGGQMLGRIYVPLLRPGLAAATLLTLVEVMKEMPATLLLRPTGWDTLAVRIYEFTSEGEWSRAALPALALVLAGIPPTILLLRGYSSLHR